MFATKFRPDVGAADEQIGLREGADDNSHRSSVVKALARLAADPWALSHHRDKRTSMGTQDYSMGRCGVRFVLCAAVATTMLTACDDHSSWEDVIAEEAGFGAVVVEVSAEAPRRLLAQKYASISPVEDASPRLPGAVIMRGPRNTYVVAGTYKPATFTIHDSLGNLVAVRGKAGAGPGEYMHPDWVVASRDSLFVFDRANSRITVLDPGYEHVRSFPRPAPMIRSLATRRDLFFMHSPPPSGIEGSEFRLINSDGLLLREFGKSSEQRRGVARPVAIAPNGALWAAYGNQYVLQQFDNAGTLTRSLFLRRPWFPPWQETGESLSPRIAAITADSSGRLWVLVARPVHGWERPPARMSRDGIHMAATDPNDMDAGYDFVLDVIDPTQARVVGSTDLPDGYFQGFIEAGVLYSFRNDADHMIHIDLWSVALL